MAEDLSHLALEGAEIAVRVTPKASRDRIVVEEGQIRVYVTTVPEDGKAKNGFSNNGPVIIQVSF